MSEYLGTLGAFQLTGVFGFLVYIFAFGRVQFGWLDGNSATFSALNVLAASLVAISLIAEFNLASALIQASWIIMGLVGIFRPRPAKTHRSVQSQNQADTREAA